MTVGRIPVIEGGIQPTLLDAKADLITATANDTPARLGVGANGTVLTADSAEATGLKWAAPSSGGGMTVISTGTLSSTGVTFSSIPSTYVNLALHITGFNVGGNRLYVRINGDSGSNYFGAVQRERNNTYYTAPYFEQAQMVGDGEATPDSGATNTNVWTFPAYTATTGAKVVQCNSYILSTYKIPNFSFWSYNGTEAAISSITIASSAGTFSAGTYTLYGVK